MLAVFSEKWIDIPEPSSATEQAEYDIILIDREVYGICARVRSTANYRQLGEVLDSATSRIEKILDETQNNQTGSRPGTRRLFTTNSIYSNFAGILTFEQAAGNLAALYEDTTVQDSARRYVSILERAKYNY